MCLLAVSPAAEAAGGHPGLPLAAARALVPGLMVFAADPAGERQTIEDLADWCGRYSPWTAVDGAAGLWLDVTGCAHLFGGETALLEDLVRRLKGFGFAARAALADTPGAAWAAARFASGPAGAWVAIPPGETGPALAPLPAAALRLDGATVDELSRLGLRTIGDLTGAARAPLAARFSKTLIARLDQALGDKGEPISPRRPPPAFRARLAFAEPARTGADVGRAFEKLLAELCARLELAHQGARRMELTLYRLDGTCARAGVGTSRPVREPTHLARLFAEKLAGLDAGFGIEVMTLAATAVDALAAGQLDLAVHRRAPSCVPRAAPEKGAPSCVPRAAPEKGTARLIDRLGNHLGPGNVVRLLARASHIPERAFREVSALAQPDDAGAHVHAHAASPPAPRPLQLLPWPEPIEVVAPVPDEAPVMFRWRRRQHRVARAEGPERIGPEWWLEDANELSSSHRIRDYYRVENVDGRRFWVYREGPYRPGVRPRWYLHGLFA